MTETLQIVMIYVLKSKMKYFLNICHIEWDGDKCGLGEFLVDNTNNTPI